MGDIGLLMDGFATALQPLYLLYALLGVTLGTAVGVLPGIGPAMTVALLLPLTYSLEPAAAFIMFAGIYYGGMYGGSTTSILLNTPGEAASIVTALEGNAMARAGRGAAALATAAIGSFVAGTVATVALTFLAPVVADLAVQLGPQDFVALTVLAFLTVAAMFGASPARGIAALAVGLLLAMVGTDSLTGQQRFTFGLPALADGIDVVVVAVGIFAVGEALYVASRMRKGPLPLVPVGGSWMTREDFRRSWKPWLRGAAVGFPIGTIPAGGADVSTFLSYSMERKLSKRKDEFGKGAIEGVAGPESANNAAAAGVLVPLLTLGLPTSATAAIIIVAFQSYGIQPGPLLFEQEAPLVWTLIASLYIGNLLLLVLNLPLVGVWVKLLQLPRPYLYAGILTFAALGSYAVGASTADMILLFLVGVLGWGMRQFGFPVAPAVVGLILGPIAEEQLRRTLAISQGDPSALVTSPFAAVVYLLLLVFLAVGVYLKRRQSRVEEELVHDRPETVPAEGNRS
ncbi:tripartite tricarboxylate transporter permease [Blastococcus sp. BMG 814]|uniref:Tripartite tricarboxylate transporter permease n=1 Tax=Blastococcus carthaginiensis TaxID=3050034 RepID=A0ABT9IFY2_9ACTN|nr:tripartite tricarboxylate transporter permease [Blastococcus carthaginiensis]MDP5184490.1 tripartite tricarboxylate transporter permease [Blastococcus carthaginiensis]